MASPIGSRGSFAIQTGHKGSSIHIQISEQAGVTTENLSLSTWGASFVLANHLHKIQLPRLPVQGVALETVEEQLSALELGAGTGLVGLAAASIWKARVTMTDLLPIVSGLSANITLNRDLIAQSGGSVSAGSLDWSKPFQIDALPDTTMERHPRVQPESSKPNIILAADTIYDEEHPQLLSNTVCKWLRPGPRSRAIFCYPLRMAYIDHIRQFWDLLEAGGLECIEEGQEEGDESWNEIFNTPYEWCVWSWKSDKSKGHEPL